mmetsp:Transcript_72192/g.132159  ORF Transcript_72192/g.132159 Transcript_72192/m.132159 type:complete len:528 (-) Transcript_72192:204-1787(-)
MPNTYKEVTYKEVARWTAETRIKYAPNPKSGKSKIRYEKYAKAKTVAQAMEFGSYPQDLFFDFEHGYIQVLGGPRREKPLDPKDENEDWTKVDKMLAKMHRSWVHWKQTFSVANKLGVDRRQLTNGKVTGEDTEVRAARLAANELAKMVLEDVRASKRKITDRDVVAVLRMWGFRQNTNRSNVLPKGQNFVFSDTLGLVANYRGCVSVVQATTEYMAFTSVLTGWLNDHMPDEVKTTPFCYTSINVNANYAGKLHRDSNNEGPSLIHAFGSFTGGALNYWADDVKSKGPVEKMCLPGQCATINLNKHLLMFDGNRGHSVQDFQGERFSLVFFSIGQYHKANTSVRDALKRCGINCPSRESMAKMKKMLGAPGDQDAQKVLSWPVRDNLKEGTSFLAASFVNKAKELAYKSDKKQEDECKDTIFVDHKITYVMLPDGRRGVRVFLVGESGGQKLVVSGDEDAKGSAHYLYQKLDSFKQGPPLSTTRIGEVRTWLSKMLGQPLKAPVKRCVSSFSKDDAPSAKRRRQGA